MVKKILQKIGASENPVIKFVAKSMRLPIRMGQWQLMKLQKDKNLVQLVRAIQKDGHSLMWPTEMAQIYNCVQSVKNLPGDYAEVGVFAGRSAKLISELKGEKALYLFDTFEGLPEPTAVDNHSMEGRMYAATKDSVQAYLTAYANVVLTQGLFPATAGIIQEKRFSFVHLDVDLYQGTLDSLKFFYPRMVDGGIILCHDYSSLDGVKKAADEFFADKPEAVIELSTSQCLVIKAASKI